MSRFHLPVVVLCFLGLILGFTPSLTARGSQATDGPPPYLPSPWPPAGSNLSPDQLSQLEDLYKEL